MNIAVLGTGYVGLTTAVSLAIKGHVVTGVEVDVQKVEQLKRGIVPIYEPGLEDALKQVQKDGRIRFSHTLDEAAANAEVLFVCVGTPPGPDGEADLSFLWSAVEQLERVLPRRHARVLAVKSTVPVGTADRMAERFRKRDDVHVVSNPEFLREGSALTDSLEPSRIVVGGDAETAFSMMEQVYAGIPGPRLFTTRTNAEMIKYASNAYLAMRISFINELSRLCERLGADVSEVARGMGLDNRIGPNFLQAGLGYGGSCFPKDTAALLRMAERAGVPLSLVASATRINDSQVAWFTDKIKRSFQSLAGLRVAVLGLAFKPHTDDIRFAPALRLIPLLQKEGAEVIATDPAAVHNARRAFPEVRYAESAYEALKGADAAVLVTEWPELVQLDWQRVKRLMDRPYLFDGRNAWPKQQLVAMGFVYEGVGRG